MDYYPLIKGDGSIKYRNALKAVNVGLSAAQPEPKDGPIDTTQPSIANFAAVAAWTFHTEKLFRLGSDYTRGMSQVEDQFLQQVRGALPRDEDWPRR